MAIPIQQVEKESSVDPEMSLLRKCVINENWTDIPEGYKSVRFELAVLGQLVLRGTRIVIPQSLRAQVINLAHEGHQGIVKSKQRLRTKVWWPGADKDIERKCKSCHGCQVVGKANFPEPIKSTPLPTEPWQHLATDILGPLPDGSYLLVTVDYYSRFFEVDILKSITTEKVIECLERIFCRFGLPESLKTDNASYFTSIEFENFLSTSGIEHRKSTPLWPQANGEVERQNRTILKVLKIAQIQKSDWNLLNNFLLAYRSTPHSTTGVSPAESLFKRSLRTKLPDVKFSQSQEENMKDRDTEMKQKAKDYADVKRHAKTSDIQIGDHVLVKQKEQNKLTAPFCEVPFEVVDRFNSQVTVESPEGVQYKRNSAHLKKYQTDETHSDRSATPLQTESTPTRPTRIRKVPKRFEDFVTELKP